MPLVFSVAGLAFAALVLSWAWWGVVALGVEAVRGEDHPASRRLMRQAETLTALVGVTCAAAFILVSTGVVGYGVFLILSRLFGG